MRGRYSVLAAGLLGMSAPAQAQAFEEDRYDKLGIAVALESACSLLRGYEGWYLMRTWEAAKPGSRVQLAADAMRKAAGDNPVEAGIAERTVLFDAYRYYRERAAEIGCLDGRQLLVDSKAASAIELGAQLMVAQATRGAEPTHWGMPLLTGEQRNLTGAFAQALQGDFGASTADIDARMRGLAAEQLKAWTDNLGILSSNFMVAGHDEMFGVLRQEALGRSQGYTAQLAVLDDPQPLGFPTIEWRKDGMRVFRFAAPPRLLGLIQGGQSINRQAYAVLAVPPSGDAILGLFGQDAQAITGRLAAAFKTSGQPATELRVRSGECPFHFCFSVPAALIDDSPQGSATLIVTIDEPPEPYLMEANQFEIDLYRIEPLRNAPPAGYGY